MQLPTIRANVWKFAPEPLTQVYAGVERPHERSYARVHVQGPSLYRVYDRTDTADTAENGYKR